jgi:hypothetical protein
MSLLAGRLALAVAGLGAAGFGGWHLLENGRLTGVLLWLAGAVVVHDGVLAPLTVLVTAVGARVLPTRARRPVLVAFVLLATVTLTAVPVLGGWGRRPDNPTLLDRHYVVGWCAFAGLVLTGTLLGAVRVRADRPRRGR